jgi:hypothetical protein
MSLRAVSKMSNFEAAGRRSSAPDHLRDEATALSCSHSRTNYRQFTRSDGINYLFNYSMYLIETMVARDGGEPPTPAFSGLRSTGLTIFLINNLIRQNGLFIVTIL